MEMMKYKPLSVPGEPELKIRYYEAEDPLKGIIVLVHGVSHGAWCWEKTVKKFTQEGYACFALNLRGHGDDKNRKNMKGARLSDYVIDVIRCMERIKKFCDNEENGLPYSKPFVIGHSMGGGIVENYISNFSEKVRGAVLFAPADAEGMGLWRIVTTSAALRGLRTGPVTLLGWRIFLAKSNFFAVKDKWRCRSRISGEDLKHARASLCREPLKAMLGLRKYKLAFVTIPVFVIGSDKDTYFSKKSLKKTAEFYDTKPMVLHNLCHDMMLDPEWDKAAEAVLEFMKAPEKLREDPAEFIKKLEDKIYPQKKKNIR